MMPIKILPKFKILSRIMLNSWLGSSMDSSGVKLLREPKSKLPEHCSNRPIWNPADKDLD